MKYINIHQSKRLTKLRDSGLTLGRSPRLDSTRLHCEAEVVEACDAYYVAIFCQEVDPQFIFISLRRD